MPEQEHIAFWGYDKFPFCLWGSVVQLCGEGLVRVKEYGGALVKPKFVLPKEEGEKLIANLLYVKSRYNEDMREVKKLHYAELARIMPSRRRR